MRKNLLALILFIPLVGCFSLSMSSNYQGPLTRPPSIDEYYSRGSSYKSFTTTTLRKNKRYTLLRYLIKTDFGDVTVDHFKRAEKSDSVVFVFPVLGGKPVIESYFADYFASGGLDSAIVHRSNEFKKPENIDRIEELLRDNVIRDRIVLDFFEDQVGKKQFASFGISRGGINVAMTAGVDNRLKHNVIVMGGTDLVSLFRESNENRIRSYVQTVVDNKGITEEQFFNFLQSKIKTDPKYLAGYLDARNTLLILSAFDNTVPFKYGMKLREQIGDPRTIVLMANHFSGLMYTQIVRLVPPERNFCVFPFDYIEGEALNFYLEKFGGRTRWWNNLPLKILQAPANLVAAGYQWLFADDKKNILPPDPNIPGFVTAKVENSPAL